MDTPEGIPQGSSEEWKRGVQAGETPAVHCTAAKGALIEGPPLRRLSQSPWHSNAMRNVGLLEIECGSPDHSHKTKHLFVIFAFITF